MACVWGGMGWCGVVRCGVGCGNGRLVWCAVCVGPSTRDSKVSSLPAGSPPLQETYPTHTHTPAQEYPPTPSSHLRVLEAGGRVQHIAQVQFARPPARLRAPHVVPRGGAVVLRDPVQDAACGSGWWGGAERWWGCEAKEGLCCRSKSGSVLQLHIPPGRNSPLPYIVPPHNPTHALPTAAAVQKHTLSLSLKTQGRASFFEHTLNTHNRRGVPVSAGVGRAAEQPPAARRQCDGVCVRGGAVHVAVQRQCTGGRNTRRVGGAGRQQRLRLVVAHGQRRGGSGGCGGAVGGMRRQLRRL